MAPKQRRVWRYQSGNQNPYIEEEQTTQWPKEKVQKDKNRSTKHTYKTKDRVTRTPLKIGGELRRSGRERTSCSTSDIRRVNLVTNPVISHERGKDRKLFTTSGTYAWSFVTHSAQLTDCPMSNFYAWSYNNSEIIIEMFTSLNITVISENRRNR